MKQSGLPSLHIADILRDPDILSEARHEARAFVERPPTPEAFSAAVEYIRTHWQRRYGLVQVGKVVRVIAGACRSRELLSRPGADVRPTPDKMRETLFDILQTRIEGSLFVDAYAGTGAVGIEALSRGARYAIFIEKNRAAANLIKSNLSALGVPGRARVIQGAAALTLAGPEFAELKVDLVFIDPPYPREHEYRAALEALVANPPKLTIVQHSTRFALKDDYGPLHRTRIVKQGENAMSFFTASSD